jgi:CHAT domain-containing protein
MIAVPSELRLQRIGLLSNPMLRAGLALAGANTWAQEGTPPVEAEDGILTGEDVTGLDLLNTELVVLSACDTGLGEVHKGEGLFGLRRAFTTAGAMTLVMSLWKIPDLQTRELMTVFYEELMHGKSRVEALRNAQLRIRQTYPQPFYWAAFVCHGQIGPLRPAAS